MEECRTVTVYPAMDRDLGDMPPRALTPRQALTLDDLMSHGISRVPLRCAHWPAKHSLWPPPPGTQPRCCCFHITLQGSPAPFSQLSGPSQRNPSLCAQRPKWVLMLDFQERVREEGQGTFKSQSRKGLKVIVPKSSVGQLRRGHPDCRSR